MWSLGHRSTESGLRQVWTPWASPRGLRVGWKAPYPASHNKGGTGKLPEASLVLIVNPSLPPGAAAPAEDLSRIRGGGGWAETRRPLSRPVGCPLFHLGLCWAAPPHAGAVPQTGRGRVGSLFLRKAASHVASQLPETLTQSPGPPSSGLHAFPEGRRNSASFVCGVSCSRGGFLPQDRGFDRSRPWPQPTRSAALPVRCGEGAGEGSQEGWRGHALAVCP